ncbi:MAG: acyl-CoA/acyl-ACP dehydrogenase [Acidimicrobiia bacterium]|nr:acyl-CoA/acyl-ACP dehydrogenase [Acidimicrobiia bacterium]
MDLDFTEEQDMLRDAVAGICADRSSLEVVRQLENDDRGYADDFWQAIAELGLLGLIIPEAHGGTGMSMIDAVVVYEELGRAIAPSPHFVSSVLSGGVLTRAGSTEQQSQWLPAIAGGEAVITPAWLEPDNSSGPAGVRMQATPTADGVLLRGAKRHVCFADSANRLLVLAREGDGVSLLLVDPNAAGVSLTRQDTIASDNQYRVDFDDVAVADSDRVGPAGAGWAPWHDTMLDGCILTGAQAVGGSLFSFDLANEYAKERVQFDKPLGAFQAISHYLADALTAVDGARTLVHQAAWARDEDKSVEQLAPMAKLFATRTFREVTGTGIQIFGGLGFTVEYDVQLYFRRAKSLELNWYDPPHLEELIAAQVLD